jgi:hypothetical protein
MMPIKQITASQHGHIAILRMDGSLARQVRPRDAPSGDYSTRWEDQSLDGLSARLTQIAIDPVSNLIIGATADNRLWRQHPDPNRRFGTIWREIPVQPPQE